MQASIQIYKSVCKGFHVTGAGSCVLWFEVVNQGLWLHSLFIVIYFHMLQCVIGMNSNYSYQQVEIDRPIINHLFRVYIDNYRGWFIGAALNISMSKLCCQGHATSPTVTLEKSELFLKPQKQFILSFVYLSCFPYSPHFFPFFPFLIIFPSFLSFSTPPSLHGQYPQYAVFITSIQISQ